MRRQTELGNPFLVALTGWNGPEERLRAKQAGFDEHLTKPVDISLIELLLANLPERRASRGDLPILDDHTSIRRNSEVRD